jgi:prolyl-tRNA synthetase
MGSWVEVSHDEKGIIWNKAISPFDCHLLELSGGKGEKVYNELKAAGVDALWDERDLQAGEKFGDADLIGIAVRLVVSEKTGNEIEWKERTSAKSELLSFDEVLKKLGH